MNARKLLATGLLVCGMTAFGDTYYVDANNGNDGWDGSSETRVGETTQGPMKTLAAVFGTGFATKSGDIVIAAAGTYAEGSMSNARVSIPDGVTLQSKEGAEKTFIVGSESPALRCADMGLASKLVGFTVTGGHASNGNGGGTRAVNGGHWNMPYIVDCIISNNYGVVVAGVHYGRCIRCRIVNNVATVGSERAGGAAGRSALKLYDCYVNGNTGGCQVLDAAECVNTTIGSDGSTEAIDLAGGVPNQYYNCVLLGAGKFDVAGKAVSIKLHRCAIIDTAPGIADFIETYGDADCRILSAAEMAIDNMGRPAKTSKLIDAGLNSYYTDKFPTAYKTDKDLYGTARFIGSAIDIGCCEYDFTAEPIDNFGYVFVTGTSGEVSKGTGDAMLLKNASSMNILWKHGPNPVTDYRVTVQVSGAGTLTVCRDGAAEPAYSVTAADGVRTLSFSGADDLTLAFALAGGDAASVATVSSFSTVAMAVISAPNGLLDVTGAQLGTNYVSSGGSLSFTITRRCEYPTLLTGVMLNGTYRAFDDQPDGKTMSFTVTDADRTSSVNISAVYETPTKYDWYVDANNGKDTNSGLHRHDAFKTLPGAFTNAHFTSGETVWALPGRYETGTMVTPGKAHLNRVAIPQNSSLRSTDGAAKTFIVGGESIRGVYAGLCASLVGFTVTGGHAPDSKGGGVASDPNGIVATVVDCVISNNYGDIVGGCFVGYYVRCRIVNNVAGTSNEKAGGAGGRSGLWMYDCYVCDNTGYSQVIDPVECRNTTIGCGTQNAIDLAGGVENRYYNCVLLGKGAWEHAGKIGNMHLYNCAIIDTAPGVTNFVAQYADTDCRILTAKEMALDALGRPAKTSALVNAGSNTYHTCVAGWDTGKDVDGVPRILSERVDLGSCEYDWRTDFARDFSRRSSVKEVSADVVETAAKRVCVPGGASVAFTLVHALPVGTKGSLPITITGAGTLTVSVGDTVVATLTADDSVWEHISTAKEEVLTFAFDGTGSAKLGRYSEGGFAILLR